MHTTFFSFCFLLLLLISAQAHERRELAAPAAPERRVRALGARAGMGGAAGCGGGGGPGEHFGRGMTSEACYDYRQRNTSGGMSRAKRLLCCFCGGYSLLSCCFIPLAPKERPTFGTKEASTEANKCHRSSIGASEDGQRSRCAPNPQSVLGGTAVSRTVNPQTKNPQTKNR